MRRPMYPLDSLIVGQITRRIEFPYGKITLG